MKLVKIKIKDVKNSCGGQGCKITVLPTYIKRLKLAA